MTAYYVVLDCFSKIETLASCGILRIKWKGIPVHVQKVLYLFDIFIEWWEKDVFLIWQMFV